MNFDEIRQYYSGEIEKNRLELDHFKLEGIRTKRIVTRYLTDNRLKIVDIGGGAGFYAFWLNSLGHSVSLVDLSPKNIELAIQYSKQNNSLLELCEIGDAANLQLPDNSFDIALLLGPLYHLTDHKLRLKAIKEAKRILKPNGILLAAVISRYASLIDGLTRNLILDDRFETILERDLQTGVHINDTDNPEYFTTAFFHTPSEIKNEIVESGLKFEKFIAIESMGWFVDYNKLNDEQYINKMHHIIDMIESNNDLIAISPHIMVVARNN